MIREALTISTTLLFKLSRKGNNMEDYIGEKEFFDLMKKANRDLNNHDRGVIWEITRLLIKGDLAGGNKMIKIIDKEQD